MAIVASQLTQTALTVDTTSKAVRATKRDSLGAEPDAPPYTYLANMNVRFTAAVASPIFWVLKAGRRQVEIRQIYLQVTFDGTLPVSAGTIGVRARRYVEPLSSNQQVSMTAVQRRSADPPPTVAYVLQANGSVGLTLTGLTAESDFLVVGYPLPTLIGAGDAVVVRNLLLDVQGDDGDTFSLSPGEGVSLAFNATTTIGQSVVGSVVWEET